MSSDYNKILEIAKRAAIAAGAAIVRLRNEKAFKINFKGDTSQVNNLVTTADLEAERIILATIKDAYPTHLYLTEESAPTLSDHQDYKKQLWIIDPVDGTTNYAYGHHQVGISIAYAEEGIVKVGIVHCPFQNETFSAIKGKGAFLNDTPIFVSRISELKYALIGTGFPYARQEVKVLCKQLDAILTNCRDIRRIGSGAIDICWVAAGRLDGFFETLKPWDIAAACLVAKESGAIVGFMDGIPLNPPIPIDLYGEKLIIACPELLPKLTKILKELS